jgi:hypothetical protein
MLGQLTCPLVPPEKTAEKVLKEFFKNIGYTVNVTFN